MIASDGVQHVQRHRRHDWHVSTRRLLAHVTCYTIMQFPNVTVTVISGSRIIRAMATVTAISTKAITVISNVKLAQMKKRIIKQASIYIDDEKVDTI
jgi:hypothetical protein